MSKKVRTLVVFIGSALLFEQLAVAQQGQTTYLLGNDSTRWQHGIPNDRRVTARADSYSTYLGGTGIDVGNGIASDKAGNVYVVGRTTSNDFPIPGAEQPFRAGGRDGFITKFDREGRLVYSTYFGGAGDENPLCVAVDREGNAYVTGVTSSLNMPVVSAFQPSYGGGTQDGFILKLSADGTQLLFSTYLGGTGFDQSRALAVDAFGNVYVTGNTDSRNFPTSLNALQPSFAGGISDAFVTKLGADGSLAYSTYLGGSNYDAGRGIAVGRAGQMFVAGETRGSFPTTAAAFQPMYGGGLNDMFVAKLSSDGSELAYASYLGGSGTDQSQTSIGDSSTLHGRLIGVDERGHAYITGDTNSVDFPTRHAFQSQNAGDFDGFLAKVSADGSALMFSTYFGGTGFDSARSIVVAPGGRAYITGSTSSNDLPTRAAVQAQLAGGFDGFVAGFEPHGRRLQFSTYLGGSGTDALWSIALRRAATLVVTGQTSSTDFPSQNAAQAFYGGGAFDTVAVKLRIGRRDSKKTPATR